MHRSGRRLTALFVFATLLLGQALVVAQACVLAAPAAEAADTCHHGAPERPALDPLCKAQCEAESQTVEQAKTPVAPALGAPLAVVQFDGFAPAPGAAGATPGLVQAGAPPPYLLHRRLRI